MAFSNADFAFFSKFTLWAWIFLVGAAVVNILGSMTKFLAIKYHKASDLQKLAFLPNIWQFFIDLFFLNAIFTGMELSGFICLFIFYGGYLTWFVHANFNVCRSHSQILENDDDEFKAPVNDIETGHLTNVYDSNEFVSSSAISTIDDVYEY